METIGSVEPTTDLAFIFGGDDGPGTKESATSQIEVGKTRTSEEFPVVFFGKKNFTGEPAALPRNFVEDDLRHIGVGWDGWSSVKIRPGHEVILWPNKKFNGPKTKVTQPQAVLPDGIREDMGSLRINSPVRDTSPEGPSGGDGRQDGSDGRRPSKTGSNPTVAAAGFSTGNIAMLVGGLGLAGAAVYYVQQSNEADGDTQ
jgi:hypothetical protein